MSRSGGNGPRHVDMNPLTNPEQNEANRAKARRSTGPVTIDGKARSSQNARVYGLCSDAEEAAVFALLQGALSAELAPAGQLELPHFETIIHSQWNPRRCRTNEANLLGSVADPLPDPALRCAEDTISCSFRLYSIGGQDSVVATYCAWKHRDLYCSVKGVSPMSATAEKQRNAKAGKRATSMPEFRLRMPSLLRCMVRRRKNRYVAECIDLNLVAMASTPGDALRSLKSAIVGHLKVSLDGASNLEKQTGLVKGLIPRPSSWRRRLVYHMLCLLAAFRSAERGFRLYAFDAREGIA